MSLKFQIHDLRYLNEQTRSESVSNEIDKLLGAQCCTICNGSFIGCAEKDNAVVSAKHPFRFAHGHCWVG